MKLSNILDAFGIGRKRKPVPERKARPSHFRHSSTTDNWVPDSTGYPTWNAHLMNHDVPCRVKREPVQRSNPSDGYTHAPTYVAATSYDSSPSSCDTSSSSSTSSDCSY